MTFQQATFDELLAARPLRDVTFVVVDLETTGATPAEDAITEIGAVKVHGGAVLGEFGTLVNPGGPIPPFITVLTGITNAMVAPAPTIATVLPSFLEFAHDAVLVAHNAPFDVGFLKAASARHGFAWPGFRVVDTVVLARRVLSRDEVPNRKLGTLARFFRAATTPNHRALDDARATVDVLHGLIGRLGNLGVHTLDELVSFDGTRVTETRRRKRHLAHGLPSAPGVYVFRAADSRPLYIGTSRDIASRVRGYFTSSETRGRMGEMVTIAERVDAVVCAHALEARVRELRLIAAHKPPYNRRSKYPEKTYWLKLTAEAYPRLSMVRQAPTDGSHHLGPFRSRSSAETALAAIHEVVALRQCTTRLSTRTTSPACVLAEMGRCGAPCQHRETPQEYAAHVAEFVAGVHGDPSGVLKRLLARIETLGTAGRYEEAAVLRDRLAGLLRALTRFQRLTALVAVPQLVAVRRRSERDGGGWEVVVSRHGRLAAAATAPRADVVVPMVETLLATAETVPPPAALGESAHVEETEALLSWLDVPGTRVVSVDGVWGCPVGGAERWGDLLRQLSEASAYAVPP